MTDGGRLFKDLFGDDEDDDENSTTSNDVSKGVGNWRPHPSSETTAIEGIPGLTLHSNYIPEALLEELAQTSRSWFGTLNMPHLRNQAMFFGNFPTCVEKLASICKPLVLAQIPQQEPIFNQSIANYFIPGQGLAFHVDLMKQFEDGIIVANVVGTCSLQFRRSCKCQPGGYGLCKCGREGVDDGVKTVFLRPADVVCM